MIWKNSIFPSLSWAQVLVIATSFVCGGAATLVLLVWFISPSPRLAQFLVIVASFVCGGAATLVLLLRFQDRLTSAFALTAVPVGFLAAGAMVGVAAGEISVVHATLLIVLGGVAIAAFARIIEMLGHGDAIELQSHWGGLGNGLGGWRLSPVTSLILLALFATSGAVAIGLVGKLDPKTQPPVVTATEKEQAKAPAKDKSKTPVAGETPESQSEIPGDGRQKSPPAALGRDGG
jgi:hypothetical protein